MEGSMRSKVEHVIRTYGTKDAPLSPDDIRAELGLTGRDKISSTLNRMMKVVPGLQRVERQGIGAPAHFCYWIENQNVTIEDQIFYTLKRDSSLGVDEISFLTGLDVTQVVSGSTRLAEKRVVKRSLNGRVIYVRLARIPCHPSHTDFGYGKIRNHSAPITSGKKPIPGSLPLPPKEKVELTHAPVAVESKAAIIRIPVQGKLMEFGLKQARDIYNQLKEIFE